MNLKKALPRQKRLRAAGIDDAPFRRGSDDPVNFAAVICANTRFEGMLWGAVRRDGDDATARVAALIETSKFLPQLHLVLLDGLALGGFNPAANRRWRCLAVSLRGARRRARDGRQAAGVETARTASSTDRRRGRDPSPPSR